jgi:hypothetical protein
VITAATAERLEAALGHLDAAARRLPACPAAASIAISEALDRARTELSAVLGRPLPAPVGDELDDDVAIPDGDPED